MSVVHIARCPEHGLHGERTHCYECGVEAEQVAMVPVADLFDAVKAGSELRSALRMAAGDVQRINALLSPGMRAGTAEAKANLAQLLTRIRGVLELDSLGPTESSAAPLDRGTL